MIILTGRGSFANELTKQKGVEVVSIRELGEEVFWQRMKTASTIIHNAASINCENMAVCLLKNFEFSRKIVDFLVTNNSSVNLTYMSSMSVLDPKSDKVFLNTAKMTPYAFSKYKAERYCIDSNIANLKVVRFSTVFYKDPTKDGLSKLIYDAVTKHEITIYNGGEATRDFIPLSVVAAYIRKVVKLHSTEKEVFNIVSGIQTSFKDIVLYLKKNIPDLKITNIIKVDLPAVLSCFSTDSIKRLGEIEFSLEDEMGKYIREIKSL